jgi:hypothetical protein
MNTKCIFLCGINRLNILTDLGEGFDLTPNEKNSQVPKIRITNNKSVVSKFLNPQLARLIGLIEYSHLADTYPIVAFAESSCDLTSTTSIKHLDTHLYFLKMYFFCLWLIKDNAADFDIGYLSFINNKREFETSCNNFTNTNFKADTTRTPTEFNLDELSQAAVYLTNNIYADLHNRSKVGNTSSNNRLTIATNFIQHARASSDMGIKMTSYCAFLETLFVNDNTELSHKLSERVSRYLEKDLEKRKQIFRLIKKSYEMRSKVIHGAALKENKTKELEELIKQVDNLCRKIMVSVILSDEGENIFEKSQEEIEHFFLELILN